MLKRIHDRKGQNTAEYAILISLVVAGIIAMQTYAQRALQGKVQASSTMLSNQGGAVADTEAWWNVDGIKQYEPYYLESNYETEREGTQSQILTADATWGTKTEDLTTRTRLDGGYQQSSYNTDTFKEAW